MKKEIKIVLSDRKIKMVVKDINKVLDEHRIYGPEWNIEVLKELIIDNLSRNNAIELIKRLEETKISEWND